MLAHAHCLAQRGAGEDSRGIERGKRRVRFLDQQRKLGDTFANVIVASQKMASAARDKFGAAGDALQTSAIPKEEAETISTESEIAELVYLGLRTTNGRRTASADD